jgi:hypothetical protein
VAALTINSLILVEDIHYKRLEQCQKKKKLGWGGQDRYGNMEITVGKDFGQPLKVGLWDFFESDWITYKSPKHILLSKIGFIREPQRVAQSAVEHASWTEGH